METSLITILNNIGIKITELHQLNGLIITREKLLNSTKYENIKDAIPEFKKFGLSSSYLTSLQKSAEQQQKWPLLNLIRQLLKAHNFRMKPIRKSIGYNYEGKKIYKRFFQIEKLKAVKTSHGETPEN